MKWIMTSNSIVGLNETNAGARETSFQVIKATPGTGTLVAEAPTKIQAQKLLANAKKERIAQIRAGKSHHPLALCAFSIVKVKKHGHHDGQAIAQVYDTERVGLERHFVL
jgi:hypothetical protein